MNYAFIPKYNRGAKNNTYSKPKSIQNLQINRPDRS